MSNKASSSERLEKLCGFDPAKKLNATGELLKEVVADLRSKREEAAKEAAKEQLVQAMSLREKMHKARQEFDRQQSKFEKELGKLLNRLEAGIRDEQAPTEEDEQE